VRAVRFAWTLPTNVLGHIAGILVSGSLGAAVGGNRACGRLYVIRMPGLRWIGGITLGHAILLSPKLVAGSRGRIVLAHELAHTRQHDVLGPFYLPLHAVAQLLSAIAWVVRPVPSSDPVHAHNPLEQRWLCVGHAAIDDLLKGERLSAEDRDSLLDALLNRS
jgi:hypothetical protein